MSSTQQVGSVVIGAGPYGLAASAHLTGRGIEHRTFGTPMGGWSEHMPKGMFLKSTARDSSIGSPHPKMGIGDWCAVAGIDPYDKDGGETPIPVAEFIDYGRWFQQNEVPEVEKEEVTRVARVGAGFEVELGSGERFSTRTVMVTIGTAPYAYVPPELKAGLASDRAGRISHSSDHPDLSVFAGRNVAVIGGGQSALESAVLLHEAGAVVHLLVRSPGLIWGGSPPPPPEKLTLLEKLKKPPSQLGNGWTHLFITRYPAAYRHLPDRMRLRGVKNILGPLGAWWLKPRFEGIEVRLSTRVTGAQPHEDGIRLDLLGQGAGRTQLDVDHVIAATGYRVHVRSLGLLSDELASSVKTVAGSPRLSAGFESSAPGLFFGGLASAVTFGPMMRFVCGSEFAGPRAAQGIAARLRAH